MRHRPVLAMRGLRVTSGRWVTRCWPGRDQGTQRPWHDRLLCLAPSRFRRPDCGMALANCREALGAGRVFAAHSANRMCDRSPAAVDSLQTRSRMRPGPDRSSPSPGCFGDRRSRECRRGAFPPHGLQWGIAGTSIGAIPANSKRFGPRNGVDVRSGGSEKPISSVMISKRRPSMAAPTR